MKQTIYIPESLSDITLSQYIEFLKDESKVIEIFCGISYDVKSISKNDYEFIVNQITKVLNQTPNELITRFKVNNIEYGFIPNLDKLTLGEFIDLDESLGDNTQLLRAMSVLYRPIVKKVADKYDIEPYTAEINQDLLNMPLDAVLSSMVFFWTLSSQLLETTQSYFQQVQQTETIVNHPKYQNLLTKNGGGISVLKSSQMEILPELMKSLSSLLPVHYITLHT